MNIGLFIPFVSVPLLSFIAFLITTIMGYKKEGERYSIKAYLPYEAFERTNPTTRIISRAFYFIYLATTLPFYAFLLKYASGYNSSLIAYSGLSLATGVAAIGLNIATTYVKATLPKEHTFLMIGHAIAAVANCFCLSNVFNLIRTGNMVSEKYNIFILVVLFILIAISTFIIVSFVNRSIFTWEYIEKDGKRKFFALAFTEWMTILATLLTYLVSVIGLFIINL